MYGPGSMTVQDAEESQERTGTAPAGELAVRGFKSFLEDCRYQPNWRSMSDKCADYQDGNQLDYQTLADLDKKGMGPLQRNIIQPLVNVVLGMEAKTRTDWRVLADTQEVQDVAEALSAKLHEVERESRADRAISDAYKPQIVSGLGWVEVSRNSDPFCYPHRVGAVHRREMWWDWRDDTPDLHKARYQIRKRWFDVDQAVLYFPEHADLLRATVGDPNRYELLTSKRALDLGMSLEESRGLDIEDIEDWRSLDRHRLCLYEVWYRVFMRGYVARTPGGEAVELSMKNPAHVVLLQKGLLRPERAVYSKLRMSMWAGPHKLIDVASPKKYTPYVPFWGYREDRTGVPYGLVRSMISPQDEVNARLQKMMWLLGAKRVVMDSDALDTDVQSPQDMLEELARPDAVVFMNPRRTNRQASFEVNDNLTLADAQFKVLQDAMQASQQVVGVFNAMLGRESGTTANSALMTLVDQGTTALAEINDNYRFARRLVGERLLDQVRDDLIGQQVDVVAGEQPRRRVISLNRPVQGQDPESGQVVQQVQNDVRSAKVKVALDDVPSSAAYREQQFTMLAELTKGLPPNLQAVIAPFVMEASDLQKRREMADALRKAMGVPTPRTPEEERAAEEAQGQAMQFASQVQQKQALLELAEREAKVKQLNAQAEKTMAEAQGVLKGDGGAQAQFRTEVAQIEAQAKGEIDRLTAEVMTVRMAAATREQKLIGELAKAVAELKANATNRAAEVRKIEAEKEIAQIEAEKDKEVARINADSQKVVDAMAEQLVKLRDELKGKIEDAKRTAEKAADDAKAERAERKAEEKARREAERESREREKQVREQVKEAPSAPPVTVVVGGESEIELTKTSDGKWKGVKRPKKKP